MALVERMAAMQAVLLASRRAVMVAGQETHEERWAL